MKIYLFNDKQTEPFRIYQHQDDVQICSDWKVKLNDPEEKKSFDFLHLQTELVECNDQVELCLLIFVKEEEEIIP